MSRSHIGLRCLQAQPPRVSFGRRTAFGAAFETRPSVVGRAGSLGAGAALHGAVGRQVESTRATAPQGGLRPRPAPGSEQERAMVAAEAAAEERRAERRSGAGPGQCREDTAFAPRPPADDAVARRKEGLRWGVASGTGAGNAFGAAGGGGGDAGPGPGRYLGAEALGEAACGNPLALARRASARGGRRTLV